MTLITEGLCWFELPLSGLHEVYEVCLSVGLRDEMSRTERFVLMRAVMLANLHFDRDSNGFQSGEMRIRLKLLHFLDLDFQRLERG